MQTQAQEIYTLWSKGKKTHAEQLAQEQCVDWTNNWNTGYTSFTFVDGSCIVFEGSDCSVVE
jgi:hypothetical protein